MCVIKAPAKINLCLHVLGKRPDGYHDLAMLMQRVSLYDRIEIATTTDGEVSVTCPGLELAPGEDNIAARAATLMLKRAGSPLGVGIRIEKEIPAAAGLGGGSSDAAAVLLALNSMLDLELPLSELTALGVTLGADVPFFLLQASAWATGIGEVLEPVPDLPSVWYLLVNPGIPVSTAWVFGNWGLTSPGRAARMREFPRTTEELVRLFHNDLEAVTIGRYPVVAEIKKAVLDCGAAGALMSGSGATVFGVFPDEESTRHAAALLARDHGWSTYVVQPIL
jgi:4-diphosphocytidyl-2-C-methyl-D-erythritol kinase